MLVCATAHHMLLMDRSMTSLTITQFHLDLIESCTMIDLVHNTTPVHDSLPFNTAQMFNVNAKNWCTTSTKPHYGRVGLNISLATAARA